MECCQFFLSAIQIANQYPVSWWLICLIRAKKYPIKFPQEIGNQPGEINCVQNVRKTMTHWEMLPNIPLGNLVKDFYSESGSMEVEETNLYGMSQRQSGQEP